MKWECYKHNWQHKYNQCPYCRNDELKAKLEAAKVEAEALALALHKDNYQEESPDFELCDSVAGVVSQINNMVAGLDTKLEALEAELERWRTAFPDCSCPDNCIQHN